MTGLRKTNRTADKIFKMHVNAKWLLVTLFAGCLFSCKKWEDHTAVENADLTKTLRDEIGQRSNLSRFTEYLAKTGLDKELASSKTYTVWAPTNEALQTIDPAIVADTARLRRFVSNHIANQTYFTRNAATPVRVPMLNGKSVTFTAGKFDEATIVEADKYVANGVLHVIDKVAPVYPSAWELLDSTRTQFQQNAFVQSLTRKVFDPTNAVVDSISAITGLPVYRPGTDSVPRNVFNTDVYDLRREDKQYTYFILTDAAYATELAKLNPYFRTSTADSTRTLASYALVKDLVVEGYYTQSQLPAVLQSKFGVNIPIDQSKIVETRRLSNGIAYVLSGINFTAREKIPEVIVQGEAYRGFFDAAGNAVTPRQNNVSAIFIRSRATPTTPQVPFTDMFAYNHGISGLNAQYQVRNLPSGKYKVYWVAPNDTLVIGGATRINPVVFNQRLAMGARGINFLPATPATGMAVAINNYSQVYLGDWVQAAYGTLDMFLTANASTGAGTNSLNLDYIRLVPE